MRLPEELMLVLLDESSGYVDLAHTWDFSCVIAGSILAELALENRIDDDLTELRAIDLTPTEDELLDPVLEEIGASESNRTTQYWVEKTAPRADDAVTTILDRLVDLGILTMETGGFFELNKGIARSRMFQDTDGAEIKESKSRILDIITQGELPDPRDILLMSLLHSCKLFKTLFEEDEYEEYLERIEILANADLIGQSIAKAIHQTRHVPHPRLAEATKEIPKVGFIGMFARSRLFEIGMPQVLKNLYERYGPVVETPLKMGKQKVIMLLGQKANVWMNKQGRIFLRSSDYLSDFEALYGNARTLSSMDGAEHYRLRKAMRPAYSRNAVINRLDEMIDISRNSLREWSDGRPLPANEAMLSHINKQISPLLLNVSTEEDIRDLLDYKERGLLTHVQKAIPKFFLKTPSMRKKYKAIPRLVQDIKSSHTMGLREGMPADIPDLILELNRQDPQFLPETDFTFPFAATVVANLYVSAAMGFVLYEIIRRPELHERIVAEADALFADGRNPAADEINMEAIDVTHRTLLESQRLYPIIPMQIRTVINQCEVEGYKLEPGTMIMVAQAVTHLLEELYPNPYEFDIDRYTPERKEHLQPGAYSVYGLGTHHCLGHRFYELQMVINLLMVFYHFRLETIPKDYKLKVSPFPVQSPSNKLKFRVAEVRNPIPE